MDTVREKLEKAGLWITILSVEHLSTGAKRNRP
jgi:hypothetical protein